MESSCRMLILQNLYPLARNLQTYLNESADMPPDPRFDSKFFPFLAKSRFKVSAGFLWHMPTQWVLCVESRSSSFVYYVRFRSFIFPNSIFSDSIEYDCESFFSMTHFPSLGILIPFPEIQLSGFKTCFVNILVRPTHIPLILARQVSGLSSW